MGKAVISWQSTVRDNGGYSNRPRIRPAVSWGRNVALGGIPFDSHDNMIRSKQISPLFFQPCTHPKFMKWNLQNDANF